MEKQYDSTSNELYLYVEGKNYTPYFFVLFTVFSILIQILSSTRNDTGNVIFALYIIGATLGSLEIINKKLITDNFCNNFYIWFLSNSILLLSFGYIIFDYFFTCKKEKITIKSKKNVLIFKCSTILFYFAILIWNIIIYILYFWGWLNNNISTYIFPWLVGNIFFGVNLFFSLQEENDESEISKIFSWYESRSVVAENNTQMLVAIISFLLPISAEILGEINRNIGSLFVLNITSAIITIGLIWIPKNNIKSISTLKHIKTVFHLLTLSLLLLNIVVIINEIIIKIS